MASFYNNPTNFLKQKIAQKFTQLSPASAFVCIAGSFSKSLTTRASDLVLSQKYLTLSTNNFSNSTDSLSDFLLKIRPKIKKVIMELDLKNETDLSRYLELIKPFVLTVTKILPGHSFELDTPEAVFLEISKICQMLPKDGFLILNYDDLLVRKLVDKSDAQIVYFGTSPKECHVWADNIRTENFMTYFELNHGVERVSIRLKTLGKSGVCAALAGAAIGVACGMSLFVIKKGLEQLEGFEHRMEIKEGIEGSFVLDNTYNPSYKGIEEALNLLNEIPARRRIIVLGEMKKSGRITESLYRKIAQKIYDEKADYVLLGGGDAHLYGDELIKLGFLAEKLEVNLTQSQIVSLILKIARIGDFILIDGSRNSRLDEVVKRVTKSKK